MERDGNEFEFNIISSSLIYLHPNSMHGKPAQHSVVLCICLLILSTLVEYWMEIMQGTDSSHKPDSASTITVYQSNYCSSTQTYRYQTKYCGFNICSLSFDLLNLYFCHFTSYCMSYLLSTIQKIIAITRLLLSRLAGGIKTQTTCKHKYNNT